MKTPFARRVLCAVLSLYMLGIILALWIQPPWMWFDQLFLRFQGLDQKLAVLLEIAVVVGDLIPVIVLCELVKRAPDTPRRSRVKLAESRYRKVALSVCIILLVAAVIAGDTGPFIWLHPGRLVALSLAPLLALYFYSGCILPWDEG